MISVGSIITGGFRLFREQPVAVMIWGLIHTMVTVGSTFLLMAPMQAQMSSVRSGGGNPGEFLMWLIPLYLFMLLFGLVMMAAAFRALVRPDAGAAAFLRLGADEARLLVVGLVWFAINMALYIAMLVVVGVVVGVLSVGTGSPFAALPIAALFALPFLAAMVIFHIRLSPAIPLTILRRQIVIGEAWRLTRGQFWKLFAGYLVIALILVVGYVLVVSITLGPYWSEIANGRGIGAAQAARLSTAITPLGIIGWILSGIYGAASYAMWAGSVGNATLGLIGDDSEEYAATFA